MYATKFIFQVHAFMVSICGEDDREKKNCLVACLDPLRIQEVRMTVIPMESVSLGPGPPCPDVVDRRRRSLLESP